MGKGQCLDHVAGFRDAAIGQNLDTALFGGARGDVDCGELWDAHPGDDPGGADGAGSLAHLDDVGAALGQKADALAAGHSPGDDGQIPEGLPDQAYGVANALAEAVCCGDGHHVQPAFHHGAHMLDYSVPVECA